MRDLLLSAGFKFMIEDEKGDLKMKKNDKGELEEDCVVVIDKKGNRFCIADVVGNYIRIEKSIDINTGKSEAKKVSFRDFLFNYTPKNKKIRKNIQKIAKKFSENIGNIIINK